MFEPEKQFCLNLFINLTEKDTFKSRCVKQESDTNSVSVILKLLF